MSKILGIETSSAAISVGLLVDGAIETKFQVAPRQHAKLVLPYIEELLQRAQLKLADLDAIAFGRGPGSFTGVRIAAAITQGLAYAQQLQVVPVSTLQIYAQGAWRQSQAERVVVAVDARMQEIYWGQYQLVDGLMQPAQEDSLLKPEAVQQLVGDGWFAVGDAWRVYQEQLLAKVGGHLHGVEAEFYPHAEDLLVLAGALFDEGVTVTPELALPVYLRNKDAWKK
ncbi:MAG: tRNA (adenosine(37)-N6)-threonylcarbamoyltransferase complex dimerization subunit type 1 TsaB [Gammaproteobacteria bacterium]|nr:tRNA (adenosine(37)-N6)-threonylcarbamoyltransferase complex dimerization subunit type 1 TsaB [Gammaproteobacteria bacterium]